jgi:hypothetical protein
MLNGAIWRIQNAFYVEIVWIVAGMRQLNSGYEFLPRVFSEHLGVAPLRQVPGVSNTLATFLAFLSFMVTGCRLESPNEVVIDNKIDINYINGLQEDLLDYSLPGSFTTDSFHLYNLVKGIKKEVNNRADYPHNFFIYKNEEFQKNVLRVFIEVDTTLLELNRDITDTITCTFERSGDNFIISKVWYNGIVKWDNYAVRREFTIMK